MTLALASAISVRAEVRPAAWITDGMVIQRGQQVTLRGTADPGEVVELDFDGVAPLTTAGKRVQRAVSRLSLTDSGRSPSRLLRLVALSS